MSIYLFFSGFRKGMASFGQNISTIINSVLLLLVYLLGAGMIFMFAILIGKHFLDKKPSEKEKTYWSDLNLKKKPVEEYYKQF